MVGMRHREIGIRIALGAQTRSVRAFVVREGTVLAIIGVSVGVAAGLAATRTLATMLYGNSARDPLTFGLAAAVLLAIAAVASWLPAHAATKVDPIHALRGDA
jgi:ABC-type antimicrobial peptide transport system permease subunit